MTMQRSSALALLAGAVLAARRPAGAQADLPTVRIGSDPIDSFGEAYFGDERGIFRDNGVNVAISTFANGATIVQGVISGDLDAGMANIVNVAAAVAHGIPLVMLAPAALFSAKHAYSYLCVAKNSPLKTAKDLTGQTIAVSTLNDFNQLGVQAWLDHNGVPPAGVKFVELKFPEMGPALQRGTVAAATIAEPSLSAAIHNGEVRTFANVYAVISPEFANIVWFATKAWVQKNPDAAKKLVAGIYATARWSNAHPADTAPIIARIAKLDPAAVAGMTRAYFAVTGDPKYVQAPLDFAYRYGLIARPITTGEFIVPLG
ncbi:MAG: ABC transporter substrate-binding protein [Candidatus Lustribacter sp.]|jgi:NitT/TauT family transport system substrate-binding protein